MGQPGLNPKSGSGLGFGLRAGGLEAKEEGSQISRSRREELDSGQLGAKPQAANVSVVDVERMEKEPQLRDQSSLPPPSKVARLSSDAAGVVTMAAPSPLVLGLGLGVGAETGTGRSAFTFLQVQELEHQALIYKYMVAGVPVPLHLVLPIWKSVAAAVSPSSAYAHYPTFMGCGSLCFNYWNSVEPEPGRCRRTDGKKWRCSRDVVPDQKYCERHMHRGRNRSRKPVEAGAAGPGNGSRGSGHGNGIPAASTAIATTAVQSNNDSSSINSTQLSISNPNGGLQLKPDATNSSSNNVSPPRLGFSPTSVLQNSTVCKTGPS